MSGNLMNRVEKLEARTGASDPASFPLIRLCVTDEDIAGVYADAARYGIPREPLQIIHLVPLEP